MQKINEEGYYAGERIEMVELVPKNTRLLLDIGCGKGDFGKCVKETLGEVTVYGIEPVQEISKIASKKIDHVYHGTLDTTLKSIGKLKFDVVSMNDVIEHIWEPDIALKQVKMLLKKDGFFILSVPNVLFVANLKQMIVNKDWRYTDSGVLDHTHMRFYTKKSIIRLLEKNSFEIQSIKGINGGPIPPLQSVLNFITFGYWREVFDLQFAIVCKPTN
jgi:2-polyprenyl-3-methyl-5-hydroxy-6-metoxy-1,4-benzoquinol methylase